MNERERREEAVFEAALRLTTDQRAAYLDQTCGGDPELRRRVEGLLGAFERAGRFLKAPAMPADARPVPASLPPAEKPGDRIGRYKLLEQIGAGGCGVVYMALQEKPVRRQVALKIIKLGMDTRNVIARFEAERQVLALMDHANIAKVFDAGATESGRPFFVMELVRGTRITDYCDENELSTRQRLDLFVQVCHAIQHAHQKGIIHRDVKPSNILVTLRDGVPVPKVIDFGIAKATTDQVLTDKTIFTQFQQFLGTPAYMSPEQAEMSELGIDTRSDIYSLGILLYELLTGTTPFEARELHRAGLDEMRRIIREQEPVPPSARLSTMLAGELTTAARQRHAEPPRLVSLVRGDLDWIVLRALEKDRTRRYETANALAMDVQRYLGDEPVLACPPSGIYRFRKAARRHKLAFSAAAAVSIALVIGLAASTWFFAKERRAHHRALAAEQAQVRLREEAEAARASEAVQRQQAEAEEKKAQNEAAKSRQVARLLEEMLQGVGPSVALGRDTTMLREILDKTAERVGRELTNQPEVAVELYLTLATTYHDLGLYKEMEAVSRQGLLLARTGLGEENESVAASLIALGDALHHVGSGQPATLEESEKYLRAALAMSRKVLGNEHFKVAAALEHLGITLSEQNKIPEAETNLREALAMYKKLLGDEALQVAKVLFDLADMLGSIPNRLAEAEKLNREALALQRKLFGDEHPEVAKSVANLALVLFNEGKLAEAETMNRQALEIWKKMRADDRLEVVNTLQVLAATLLRERKLAEAESVNREALALQRKLLGNDHPDVAQSLDRLARTLAEQGNLAEAETGYREALAMQRKLRGKEDPTVALALNSLVDVLLRERKSDEAEHLFNELYTPTFEIQPTNAWLVLSGRGDARARMGRWKEATADYSRLVGFEPENSLAYHALASLLVQTGDVQGYRRHCAQEVARFAATTDPFIAHQMAKDCLILPDSGVDLSAVGAWADTAVTAGKDNGWFQLTKGLAEYRQGNFVSAVDWIQKALAPSQGDPDEGDVQAYLVLAMAQYRSKQTAEAKATLAKAVASETMLPKLGSGDFGSRWRWIDWIIAHTLAREAEALIEGEPAPATEKKAEPR